MQIIDYFHTDDQPHWLAAIAENEWRAAKFLAELLGKNEFHSAVGKGTVYLLTEGDKLVSFLTLAERDCVEALRSVDRLRPYCPGISRTSSCRQAH